MLRIQAPNILGAVTFAEIYFDVDMDREKDHPWNVNTAVRNIVEGWMRCNSVLKKKENVHNKETKQKKRALTKSSLKVKVPLLLQENA